jgi:DNA-binding response OmpR family regulator
VTEAVTDSPTTALPILVVDDEPHIGRIIRTRLEQDGFRVMLAESGVEALDQLQREPDVGLPGMSGIDILRVLREDTRWSALPCIVLTAAGQEAHWQEAEALGVAEVMSKPFSPRRLLARVRHHMRGPRASADDSSLL